MDDIFVKCPKCGWETKACAITRAAMCAVCGHSGTFSPDTRKNNEAKRAKGGGNRPDPKPSSPLGNVIGLIILIALAWALFG